MTNSSSVDRDDPPSKLLKKLESISQQEIDESDRSPAMTNGNGDLTPTTADEGIVAKLNSPLERQKMKKNPIVQSITIPSTGKTLDVTAELDLILKSLDLATPHPPDPKQTTHSESNFNSENPIDTEQAIQDRQLFEELNTTRAQLATVATELQSWQQATRSDIEEIDASVRQLKQVKFRTQQLNRDSTNQIAQIQKMLADVERVRTEIFTGLEQFGGYTQIQSLLTALETARQEAVVARDRLNTGQDDFYESLTAIQEQVSIQSNDAIAKLHEYQESIYSLTQTVSTDRLQIAGMSMDMSVKFTELHRVHSQISSMHAQMVEKSAAFQSQIVEIEHGFSELSTSVRQEKDQFYELTVETIDKADAMHSELVNIVREISNDREEIDNLKTEIASLKQTLDRNAEQELDYFDIQFYELMSNCNELTNARQEKIVNNKKLYLWLWTLSFAVGIIVVLLVRILTLAR